MIGGYMVPYSHLACANHPIKFATAQPGAEHHAAAVNNCIAPPLADLQSGAPVGYCRPYAKV